MTTDEKSTAILKEICSIVNKTRDDWENSDPYENSVRFGYDCWDEYALTIYFPNGAHSHAGVPDGDLDVMIDHLYELLINHRGLSKVEV